MPKGVVMKRAFSLFFLIFSVSQIWAQNTSTTPEKYINKKTKQIEFGEVVPVEGSKNELFKRCVYWLNDFYKDPTRITLVRDANTGKIVGRHVIRIYKTDPVTHEKQRYAKVYYTFTIQFKDGKYKWQLDKLELVSKKPERLYDWFNTKSPDYKDEWRDYLTQILDFVDAWSTSLKKKMMPESSQEDGDDW